jgi:hypothetical protein
MQEPPDRCAIIALRALSELCGFIEVADFRQAHRQWLTDALGREMTGREKRWSEAIAVGGQVVVEEVKKALSIAPERCIAKF